MYSLVVIGNTIKSINRKLDKIINVVKLLVFHGFKMVFMSSSIN